MAEETSSKPLCRVGLLYDDKMCKHSTPDGGDHPENPDRIRSIWKKLMIAGIPQRCVLCNAKVAEDKYLLSVHSKHHVDLIKHISSEQFDSRRNMIALNFNSIYLNKGSSESAILAAGSIIEVTERVAMGELDSAFAIIRPPGHHAEQNEPMGFCLYNNVAVAASFLLNERPELGINKILVVDWDVHHGNGTQQIFWKDSRLLFFSVHRHEFGTFYPGGDDGSHTMIGEDLGKGFNINVPWEKGGCGDADYLAVWDHILIPVAKDFDPDMIIISAGFDAAVGDPLGGCCVTPYGYGTMLKKLKPFANGRIVMALEGGYNFNSLSKSVLACIEVLLDEKHISGSLKSHPFKSTWRVIRMVRQELSAFWPILADEIPIVINQKILPVPRDKKPHKAIESVDDLIKPLSEMKVNEDSHNPGTNISTDWRSELSNVDVWYVTYGSNMLRSRFLCYIDGGQVEGMKTRCSGSLDKSPPKAILWKTIPHRILFGYNSTSTWGLGGVAFLHPQSSNEDNAHVCMYKITLEQFNDVVLQENNSSYNMSSPLFDLPALDSIANSKSFSLAVVKESWYHNVLYLGKEQDIPMLTMTCGLIDILNFKSGKSPLCAPSEEYANVIAKGLIEGNQVSEENAKAYIEDAHLKPL